MRVDNDTYVWGVAKIIIERKTDEGNERTQIRFVGPDGEESNANVCVWGGRWRGMPSVEYVVDDAVQTLLPGTPMRDPTDGNPGGTAPEGEL